MAASGYKYLILGGGQAAGYAAAEFVKRGGKKGELGILSSEAVRACDVLPTPCKSTAVNAQARAPAGGVIREAHPEQSLPLPRGCAHTPALLRRRPADQRLHQHACAGAPRLPGFNTCVGGGGEKQEQGWYAEHGERGASAASCWQHLSRLAVAS